MQQKQLQRTATNLSQSPYRNPLAFVKDSTEQDRRNKSSTSRSQAGKESRLLRRLYAPTGSRYELHPHHHTSLNHLPANNSPQYCECGGTTQKCANHHPDLHNQLYSAEALSRNFSTGCCASKDIHHPAFPCLKNAAKRNTYRSPTLRREQNLHVLKKPANE